jgi:transcriptional regulator with XRE-family HTH domain
MTPSEINIRVGAAIRNRRVLQGLSQQAVGTAVGVTFQAIQKMEAGKTEVSVRRVWSIARALGWTVTELLAVALDEPAALPAGASDRATLEFAKRFSQLRPHERKGVTLLMSSLAGVA